MRWLLALSLVWVLLGCSQGKHADTGGTETTNARVVGVLLAQNNSPVADVEVRLYPSNAHPEDTANYQALVDTTRADGGFSIPATIGKTYSLSAKTEVDMALMTEITVAEEEALVPPVILAPHGTIKVAMPVLMQKSNGSIFIPGTDISRSYTEYTDTVVLSPVPQEASFAVAAYDTMDGFPNFFVVDSAVYLSSEDTAVISHKTKVLCVVDSMGGNLATSIDLYDKLLLEDDLEITLKSVLNVTAEDSLAFDVLLLTPSVESFLGLNALFHDFPRPLVVTSASLFPLLSMAGSTDSVFVESVSNLFVVEPHVVFPDSSFGAFSSHALYDPVSPIPLVGSCTPVEQAEIIAVTTNDQTKSFIFMLDYRANFAPSSRMGMYGSTNQSMNSLGVQLVSRALQFLPQSDYHEKNSQ